MVEQSGHDETVDVWCLGIFMFELLYGKPPFERPSVEETIALIRKGEWEFPEEPQVHHRGLSVIGQHSVLCFAACVSVRYVARLTHYEHGA